MNYIKPLYLFLIKWKTKYAGDVAMDRSSHTASTRLWDSEANSEFLDEMVNSKKDIPLK